MLGDRREQIFDELRIRVFTELDRWRLQNAAHGRDGGPQLQMRLQRTGEARDVVDEDNHSFAAVAFEEGKHRLHGRSFHKAARGIVAEGLDDLIAFHARELAAPHGLRFQPVALGLLLSG